MADFIQVIKIVAGYFLINAGGVFSVWIAKFAMGSGSEIEMDVILGLATYFSGFAATYGVLYFVLRYVQGWRSRDV